MELALQHKYANVKRVDITEQRDDGHALRDNDESPVSEVNESLLGDQKMHDWGGERPSKRRGFAPAWRSWRWVVDTVLLVVILGFVVRDQRRKAGTQWVDGEMGSDFTGVHPKHFPTRVTRFTRDPSYAPSNTSEFFTDEVLQLWNELMPKGMGFVWLNETHKYHDLPKPIEWPDKTVFTTSVTHTLHCLFAIVQTYSGFAANHPIPGDHHWHMIHCFDYMRNYIMCNADVALEGHAFTFPDDNSGSDGWDSTHVCRDYDAVKAHLETVRAYDDQLIY